MSVKRILKSVVAALCLLWLPPCVAGAPPVAFLGDSNLWIGGDDCRGPRAWSSHFVGRYNPSAARSFARSGATWTNCPDTRTDTAAYSEVLHADNVIYNQATRLIGAVERGEFPVPSLIFVAAGTNDAWFRERRPGIYLATVEEVWDTPLPQHPSQALSLAASVRLTVETLRRAMPATEIILVAPPYTTRAPREEIDRVSQTLSACADRLGVRIVRMDILSGIDPGQECSSPRLTTDGTHTSAAGAARMADVMYNFLLFNGLIED